MCAITTIYRWGHSLGRHPGEGHVEAIEIIGWIARCMIYIGIKEMAVYELSTHSIASRSAELANLFQQLLILNSERASTTVCSPMSSYDM